MREVHLYQFRAEQGPKCRELVRQIDAMGVTKFHVTLGEDPPDMEEIASQVLASFEEIKSGNARELSIGDSNVSTER